MTYYRVADPGGFYPDPDPTFQKRNRIRIRIRPTRKANPDPTLEKKLYFINSFDFRGIL